MAIVDGSSLGQVASQTLPNILATRYSTSMPVLSPLIGLDRWRSNIGKKIGPLKSPYFQMEDVKLHLDILKPMQYYHCVRDIRKDRCRK